MKLVIDFETVDPHLDVLGSGWGHGDIDIVGASIRIESWPEARWFDNKQEIIAYVNNCTHIIAHNLQYDVGILIMWGVDISSKHLVDTMVLAKIHNSILLSYSLDNLSKKYLGFAKAKDELAESVMKHSLYRDSKGRLMNTKQIEQIISEYPFLVDAMTGYSTTMGREIPVYVIEGIASRITEAIRNEHLLKVGFRII